MGAQVVKFGSHWRLLALLRQATASNTESNIRISLGTDYDKMSCHTARLYSKMASWGNGKSVNMILEDNSGLPLQN